MKNGNRQNNNKENRHSGNSIEMERNGNESNKRHSTSDKGVSSSDLEAVANRKLKVKRVSSSDLSTSSGTETGLNGSTCNSDEILDFDDIIHHFGDCGRYQMLLFVLMIPFICFIAFVFYSQMLITLVPAQHWCRVPELEDLSVQDRLVEFATKFFHFYNFL